MMFNSDRSMHGIPFLNHCGVCISNLGINLVKQTSIFRQYDNAFSQSASSHWILTHTSVTWEQKVIDIFTWKIRLLTDKKMSEKWAKRAPGAVFTFHIQSPLLDCLTPTKNLSTHLWPCLISLHIKKQRNHVKNHDLVELCKCTRNRHAASPSLADLYWKYFH